MEWRLAHTSDSLGLALAIVFDDIVPAGIALYAAFWAFSIRRALGGRIYRNYALSLGVMCVILGLVAFGLLNLLPSTGSTTAMVASNIVYFASISVIFAFMDSAIRVARRSDPLLRSVLRWEKLRFVVWGDIGLMVVASAYLVVDPSVLTSSFAGFYVNVPASAQYSDFSSFLGIVSSFFPLVVGAPALLIGAERSRDPVLRGSFKWVGVVLLLILATFFEGLFLGPVTNPSGPISAFLSAVIGIPASYALYRSARSLAPINRLQAIESVTVPSSDTAEI